MEAKLQSVLTAVAVVCAATCVAGGNWWRDRVDRGDSAAPTAFDSRSNESASESTPKTIKIDGLLAYQQGDVDVSEGDYFRELASTLEEKFFQPITDEEKLASGAVRGMVISLNDPNSLYMDKDEFSSFNNSRSGKYEGIGVSVRLDVASSSTQLMPDSEGGDQAIRIPRVVVDVVVPGGPADKAGVQVGDEADTIDGRWIISPGPLEEFQAARAKLGSATPTPEILQMAQKLRKLEIHALRPLKAVDALTIGSSGTVDVVWRRGTTKRETKIDKGLSDLSPVAASGSAIQARFSLATESEFKSDVQGKSEVTLDLRNNVNGDFAVMQRCLAALAPTGTYGYIVDERGGKQPRVLAVARGNASPPKMTLLVDKSTGGAAEVFAEALQGHGIAKLEGGPMSGLRDVIEVFALPDGSGYTLTTGAYSAHKPTPTKTAARNVHRSGPVAYFEAAEEVRVS